MNIYEKTVLEALERPSTLKALRRKTGYDNGRLFVSLIGLRAEGYRIRAVMRKDEPTYFERTDENNDTEAGRLEAGVRRGQLGVDPAGDADGAG